MTTAPVPDRVTAVPRRMRLACAIAAAVVVVVMVVVALTLRHSSTGVVHFGGSDQLAMVAIGLIIGAGFLALGRPRVDADRTAVRVRNLIGTRELPWDAVRSVRFDRKAAWATLLLTSGDELALMAVQAADRERAVAAVEGLRALLAAGRTPEPPRPPLLYDS